MSRSDQKGQRSLNRKAKARARRFESLTDAENIDLRLLLALSLAWPLSLVPIVIRGGVAPLEQVPWLLAGFVLGHGLFSGLIWLGKVSVWRLSLLKRHPSVALLTLFLATILSAVLGQLVFQASEPASVLDVEIVLLRFIVFTAIFLAMAEIRQFNKLVKELEEKQAEQLGLIEQTKSEAKAERDLVRVRLAEVQQDVLQCLSRDPGSIVSRLRQLSEDVVRPWSHNLAEMPVAMTVPKVSKPWPSWKTVVERAFTHRVIRPLPIASLITFFSMSYSVRVITAGETEVTIPDAGPGLNVVFDAQSFTVALLQVASIFAATYIAALLVARLDRSAWFKTRVRSGVVRAAIQLGSLTAVSMFLLATLFTAFGVVSYRDLTLAVLFFQAFPVLVIGALTTLVAAIKELRDSLIEELTKLNLDVRRELVSQNQALLHVRRELSNALHGPVRAALLSTAFAYNQKPPGSPSLLHELAERLENPQLLKPVATTEDAISLINQTIELWRDSCSIELEITDEAKAALEIDIVAASFLSQILNESITNAITHGGAKTISGLVSVKSDNLSIEVSDDGVFSAKPQPGLGSQMMDSLTLEWGIEVANNKTLLSATLPLIAKVST